jgi:hypothetical protein
MDERSALELEAKWMKDFFDRRRTTNVAKWMRLPNSTSQLTIARET